MKRLRVFNEANFLTKGTKSQKTSTPNILYTFPSEKEREIDNR